MVWFPIPNTGLYYNHALEIKAIPDESGTVNPVTLTWFHTDHGDIPLHSVKYFLKKYAGAQLHAWQ